ncbi:YceI family protein [Paucihalobacter ruber]|uniref:YceI family protein n=1 Tax=Paucihalobacter ruber TaxID=2567861 RepID=A0A506PK76_9FLAO|nr:YceI family protein [Paucihalobacter ruber]TPV33964.1 YceI family protein [Paucihalobacter ruber]
MIKLNFKRIANYTTSIFVLVLMFAQTITAQNFKLDKNNSSLLVLGTSNVHDWEVKAENQEGNLVLNSDQGIKNLQIIIEAEGLKSGKSGMDKNTYKALNTKTHKNIEFKYTGTTATEKNSNGSYKLSIQGELKINGVTKVVPMSLDVNVSDNQVTLNGKKTIKMTDFEVEPPTALLGTIKTGDEVTISFNSKFNK